MAFYNKEISEIFNNLGSSENGLTTLQPENNRKIFGDNIIQKEVKDSFFKKLLCQFKNLMIIILIISASISTILSITNHDSESLFEGILIFFIVIVNAIVGVIQEQKAENALSALTSSAEPFAKVYRDNKLTKVKVHSLVVGDIIELKTGDIIPADARIISEQNFKCNESSLTGESHHVSKKSGVILSKNLPLAEQTNMCFSGTSVTSGSAKAIVVQTGKNSELGKIAKMLSSGLKEKTPLEKNIDKIGKVLTISILIIVAIILATQLVFNKNQSILNAVLSSVALAVAAIPESLPAIITIIMAIGVQRLARENAIVKKLSAVETLGSCNVICTDKTGTLTQNNMKVKHIFCNLKLFDENNFNLNKSEKLKEICVYCNNSIIGENGISSDATEKAITDFILNNKIDYCALKNNNRKVLESEFNSTKKTMSILCENNILYSKGAVDFLLKKCKFIEINGKISPISEKYRKIIINENEKMCETGERVIALAYRNFNEITDENYKKIISKSQVQKLENNLIFVGLLGIIDPPKLEAEKSIIECKNAGLKVVMITGDHPSTAFVIAKQLKIATKKNEVITGQEISKLSSSELSKIINKYTVFARVTPEHKLMIVNALKTSGNIVAMTGDGVNDAPSVKQANIGVSMGQTGTDVTKQVADIIISDDNFSTIVLAIKQGRTIYQNIVKTIQFLISTNIVEVVGIFITSLVIPETIFLTASQILFINLVTDSLPAFSLGVEPAEPSIMQKPPRNPNSTLLSGNVGTSIIYQGFIQSLIVLVMFISSKYAYGDSVASTMAFLTICFMQIIHAINCKSSKSIFKINIFKNHFFNFSFLALFSAILCAYFVPFLAQLFCIVPLDLTQWLIVVLTSISIIPLVEIGKIFIKCD